MTGVPFTFATATTAIPLSELDVCFATNVTIGGAQVGLGNAISDLPGLNNVGANLVTSANAIITSNLTYGGVTANSSTTGTGGLVLGADGTFSVTDASGAGLSLVTARGAWSRIGTRYLVDVTVSYPATADGSNAVLGGMPGTFANVGGVGGSFLITCGSSIFLAGVPNANTNTFGIYNSSLAHLTNSQLSGLGLRFQFILPTV
jgi:hypothetical protein